MATSTHPGPVNLHQLGRALGGVALDASGDLASGPVEITADIDPATLDAAVSAHVADPTIQPAPDLPAATPSLRAGTLRTPPLRS